MAIVANRDGAGITANGHTTGALDRSYVYPNRTTTATPLAALTPQYSGEIVQNTTDGTLWFAEGLTTGSWVPVAIGV